MRTLFLTCWCVALLALASHAQAPPARQTPIPDTNPFSSEADVQQGAALFQVHCTYCHGAVRVRPLRHSRNGNGAGAGDRR